MAAPPGVSWHPALDWLVERLASLATVRRVILFGSRARGEAGAKSDIDLAVEAPEADPLQWSDIAETVDEAPTLLSIDLVRLDRADDAFREQILREGVTLFER